MPGRSFSDAWDRRIALAECAFEIEKSQVMGRNDGTPLPDRRAYLKSIEFRLDEMHELRRRLTPDLLDDVP